MSVVIFGKSTCNWCDRAQEVCAQYSIECTYKDVDDRFDGPTYLAELQQLKPDAKTVPQIWWNGKYIGGYNELVKEIENTREYGQGRL